MDNNLPSKPHCILVVGAGLAGSVYARELADAGYQVHVIDRRAHIAGNCFDEIDANGVRVHRYGPHLFHTSNKRVFDWLSRFTEWLPYEHKVVARMDDGRLAPLPVNLQTVNMVFGKNFTTATETEHFLSEISEHLDLIETAQDHLYSVIGRALTDLFFRPYTKKMWQLDLSEMPPEVVRRLKVRPDNDPRYFPDDTFQALPKDGYTALFGAMLDHNAISVETNRVFDPHDTTGFAHVFNSMAIDEFFDFRLGELPYRSIRFHTKDIRVEDAPNDAVINYTDDGPFTRETWWHNLPGHIFKHTGFVTRTIEEPCDYRENAMERYYPVKSYEGHEAALYQKYKLLAANDKSMSFIGRCGTYQYLDMHQVVNQSLAGAAKFISAHKPG